jgi:hypothetical protein
MEEARVQRLAEPSGRGAGFSRDRDESRESWSGAGSPREGRTPRPQGRPPLRGSEPLDQRLERWVNRGRDLVDGVSGARPGGRPAGGRDRDTGVGGNGGFNPARLGRWVEQRLDWLLDEDGEDDWREPWQEEPSRSAAAGPAARGSAPRAVAAGDGPGSWLEPRSERLAAPPAAAPPAAGSPMGRRRGLEAISRRGNTGVSTGAATPPFNAAAAGNAAAAESLPEAGRPPAAAPSSPDGRTPSAMPAGPEGSPPDQDTWPDEASFSVPRWRRPPAERPTDPLARPTAPPAGAPEEGGGRPLPRSSRRR